MGKTKERAWRNTDVNIWKKQKPPPTFRSGAAKKRYDSYSNRATTLLMERGFACSEYNPLVTQVIESHQWETFCQPRFYASIALVKEFYANYDATKPDSVYVRGKLVDVSSSAINSFFSLTDHQNTFFERSSNLSFVKMRTILKELTQPGTQWASNEDMTFPRRSLKKGPRIWNKFIQCNLLPSSHDIKVEKDTAILLYCIMVGKPINVGKLIAKQIGVCAGLNKDGLWFPALITRLCERNNVHLIQNKLMKENSYPLYVISQSDDETSESDQETSGSDHETSQADQETNQSDQDPLSPITISSDQSRDDTMLISRENSGDDELLEDVEVESCELPDDVSPMSDYAQSVEHGAKLAGSKIEVPSPLTKISFDNSEKKHKVLIDDNDDGVELLNLKKKHGELDKNVSPSSDCLQSGIICVQGYKVKESVGPILKSIFKKHGDIAAECVFRTESVKSSFLESICEVVRRIQTNEVTEKMEEIKWKVSDAAAANINVSWIQAHLDTIHKRNDSMKKSSLLMETKTNTVLATLAAQKDLREKCEELMAAQERFVEAERSVRVLLLVNKNLNNDILESNAEKDSLVEQPILL